MPLEVNRYSMNFKKWLLSEKTLYHGTIVDNEASIRQIGLVGAVGAFQQHAGYDDDYYGTSPTEDDEVVYMTDKKKLDKAISAMVHHVAQKLGKGRHDVTDNDIRNHGLIVKIEDGDEYASRRPEDPKDEREEYPRGAESGDYYASEISGDVFVKGAALLRMVKRLGYRPSWQGEPRNQSVGRLVAVLSKLYPDKTKQELVQKAQGLSDEEIDNYTQQYGKAIDIMRQYPLFFQNRKRAIDDVFGK